MHHSHPYESIIEDHAQQSENAEQFIFPLHQTHIEFKFTEAGFLTKSIDFENELCCTKETVVHKE